MGRIQSSGQPLREFKGHGWWIWALAFSPDERRLLTGSQDDTVKLWEVATGRELLTLKGHTDAVTSACFANDRRIITGSDDQTIKIWEAASPEEVAAWDQEEKAASEKLERLRRERDRARAQETNARLQGNK